MADIHALFQGQEVDIWSNSQKKWVNGKVVQKGDFAEGILVRVRYGEDPPREKWLDAALVAKSVRVATRPQGPALGQSLFEASRLTARAATNQNPSFNVGDQVLSSLFIKPRMKLIGSRNFGRSVLSCIEADFCKQILI